MGGEEAKEIEETGPKRRVVVHCSMNVSWAFSWTVIDVLTKLCSGYG